MESADLLNVACDEMRTTNIKLQRVSRIFDEELASSGLTRLQVGPFGCTSEWADWTDQKIRANVRAFVQAARI